MQSRTQYTNSTLLHSHRKRQPLRVFGSRTDALHHPLYPEIITSRGQINKEDYGLDTVTRLCLGRLGGRGGKYRRGHVISGKSCNFVVALFKILLLGSKEFELYSVSIPAERIVVRF